MSIETRLRRAAQFFEQLPQPILVVGHLDTDGLAATTIITKLLDKKNKQYKTKILAQLSPAFLNNLPEHESLIILDGGSTYPFTKPTLVIDHHQETQEHDNVFLLNLRLDGVNGSKDVCAATTAFLLAQELGLKEQAALAVLGAVGDNQDKPELQGMNKKALDVAKQHGVTTIKAPQLFGVFSEPLLTLLFKSHDLAIKGITRSKKGIVNLLKELDIDSSKTFAELSKQQQETLIQKLEGKKGASLPIHTQYSLPYKGVLHDAKKAATFINACGRLNKAEIALQTLRYENTQEPQKILEEYRITLNKAMKVYEEQAQKHGNMVIFLAKDTIPPAIAGTVCSIVTRSRMVPKGTIVVALARYDDITKVSIRARDCKENLFELIQEATEHVQGECGGHAVAAGAIISTDKEQQFIDYLLKKK